MPMIIRVLEHLEFFASNAEKGTEELEDLKFEIKKLRTKEEEKALEKQRLDKVRWTKVVPLPPLSRRAVFYREWCLNIFIAFGIIKKNCRKHFLP